MKFATDLSSPRQAAFGQKLALSDANNLLLNAQTTSMNGETIFAIGIGVAIAAAIAATISLNLRIRRYRRTTALRREESLHIPVGIALAEQIARYLKAGSEIAYYHRDSCGMGLFFIDGKYVYGPVYDGFFWPNNPESTLAFSSDEDFSSWLAAQTDFTFGAETNWQSMTRTRLMTAIERCSVTPT